MPVNEKKPGKAGWSTPETDRLFMLATEAQRNARSLKSVIDEVASLTGRRPNSVRNYYYARVKEDGGASYGHRRAFVPFEDTEAVRLLEEVLRAQGRGESVRSCTLRLAGGDDKVMLRYQNKYRAMLKNDPSLVRRVVTDLQKCGEPVLDPFAVRENVPRVGRPPKRTAESDAFARRVLADLARVPGLDTRALLDSLGTLAVTAVRGAEVLRNHDAADPELSTLQRQLDAQRSQIQRQNERYRMLLNSFAQLIRINSEFLSLNSVVKVSNLSSYIRDLELNVRSCEQLMHEGTH